MGANTLIACSAKIAVIAKDLIAKRIALLFDPSVEKPARFLMLAFFPCGIADMVNGEKLGIGLTTASTAITPISTKRIISISLASICRCCKTFFSAFRIVLVPILFSFVGMVDKKLAGGISSFLWIFPIRLFGQLTTMTIFVIPRLATIFTRRVITTFLLGIFRKSRKQFNLFTLTTLFYFHSKFIIADYLNHSR